MSENREGVHDIESGVVHFRSRYRAYSVLSICLVGLTGTLLGHNTGVLMGAFSLFQDKLEIQIITGGFILSATTAVSPICSYLGYHIISSWLGNRYTLILTSVLYIALELIMGFGKNIVVVFVAWLVLSLSMGYNLVPTYIEEVRPPKRKWVKAVFSDNSTKFGTIIGFVAYNIIHTRWWLMSIIAVIPALVIDALVFYMPESPKWLVLKGRVKEAKSVLLMTSSDETEADSRLMNLYLEYPNSFTDQNELELTPLLPPFSPSASTTDTPGPIRMIHCDETGAFQFDLTALVTLQHIKGPIGVVSICGPAGQGKSTILNQLIGKSTGFRVGSTHEPCTKGIWLWSEPIRRTAPDGSEYSLILIDSEGIFANDEFVTQDMHTFSLLVLLSSMFIYNQMGGINESAIDRLSLVTDMIKHVRGVNSEGPSSSSALGMFSPAFIWLLRDFCLDSDNGEIQNTPRGHMETALSPHEESGIDTDAKNEIRESIRALFPERECFTLVRPLRDENEIQPVDQISSEELMPEYRNGLEAFTKFVFERTTPKQVGGMVMTGPIFVRLTQSFLDAINNGVVPTIPSSWQDLQNKNFQCLSAITHFKMTLREAVSKCRSTEEKVVQLENQLETCERRYEDVSREGLSWKRKYERVLSKDAASAEIAVLKSRTTAAQSRLAAARQQTQTARNEAEGWKKRYKRAVQEESQQERD